MKLPYYENAEEAVAFLRAFTSGYRHGRLRDSASGPSPHSDFPDATRRGYWEGHRVGLQARAFFGGAPRRDRTGTPEGTAF